MGGVLSGTAGVSRRDFLQAGAAAGAGALLAGAATGVHGATGGGGKADELRVAIIGVGAQGRVLLDACMRIPGLRFQAVCDIWNYSRQYGQNFLKKSGHDPRAYEDYREMLASEKDLDAVIVATPDFVHAEHSIACLRAGLNVYCEKLMAHTVEAAREMVLAARETGKKLQIGHQRRSNPRYLHVLQKLLGEAKLAGRMTNINGQWNRAVNPDLTWGKSYTIPEETLAKYGYANMREFRNWRWFKRYGGGPISDLGAHQIDVFNWFLGANPASVMAGGGNDYYKDREWYDNVMAIYEYPAAEGVVRAFYQVLTTTSAGGGYFEYFMGTEGSIKMSENPRLTKVYREAQAQDWAPWERKGYIKTSGGDGGAKPWEKPKSAAVDVRETAQLAAWDVPVVLDKAIHQPHLENFFDAVRNGTALNCPPEAGFASAVTILRVNEAVAAGRKLEFRPDEFVV